MASSNARRWLGDIIVDDDGVRLVLRHDAGQFARLAGTHVCGRVRLDAVLQQAVAHHGARGFGERGEVSERFLGRGLRGLAAGPYAYEHDAFEPDFTVFDFGDVLQLAETGDMLELVAGLALLPFLVGVLMPAGRALAVVEQHFGLLGQHTFRGNVVVAAVDVGVLGVVGQVRLVWLEWFTILLWSFIIIT